MSTTKLFYNGTDNTLRGIYEIHEMGDNEFKSVNGSGCAVFKWNSLNGELIEKNIHRYTYDDIYTDELKDYLNKQGVNDVVAGESYYPKIGSYGVSRLLKNGNFIMRYSNISGSEGDKFSNVALNKALRGCDFVICMDPKGQVLWKKFIIKKLGDCTKTVFTEDDKMVCITYGSSVNYPNKIFEFISEKGPYDLFVYHYFDLVLGETIVRKSFEVKTKTTEHTRVITNFNEKANKFSFGLQSNSGGSSRKSAMTIVDLSSY
jgi:hypothetical protein